LSLKRLAAIAGLRNLDDRWADREVDDPRNRWRVALKANAPDDPYCLQSPNLEKRLTGEHELLDRGAANWCVPGG
jgi:hypothetical protein